MSRIRMSRVLGLVVAVFAGLTGALVIASPASAHHSDPKPDVTCVNGDYKIVWTISSVAPSDAKEWKLLDLSGNVGTLNVTAPTAYQSTGTPFVVTQTVPGSTTSVTITYRSTWKKIDKYGHVSYYTEPLTTYDPPFGLGGNCQKAEPQPTVSYDDQCNNSVDVTLINTGRTTPTTFVVNGTSYQVAAGATSKKTITDATTVTVTVNGTQIGQPHQWAVPRDCAKVKVASKVDCDKLSITFENPQGPTTTYTVLIGNKTVTGNVPIGNSDTEPFAATTGTTATVTVGNQEPVTITWERPETCVVPTTPPATTTPALAETGNNINGVVGIGAGLLAGGVGLIALLFVMRRRRTVAGS